jgi:two-component system response regulator AlgR
VTPLRILIVDDEPLARMRLAQLVAELATAGDAALAVDGEFADARATLAWLETHDADLLLLDIQMPGLDGTELAQRLQALPRPPAVVFVTAHAEHALRAFELEAVDYLTKPVKRERLRAAIGKVQRRRESTVPAAQEPVIVVSERGRLVRVPVHEVLYLKAELKYVTLRTARHSYVLDDALTELEQRLGERFLRVHRNAVVAKSAVRALERRSIGDEEGDEASEGWAVQVAPTGEWLSVSRRQVGAVREALSASGL